MAPTIAVEHLRAAENVGIALANQLKAAGADEIVNAAKQTIKDEIMMQKAEKDAAIKKLANSDSQTTTTTTTAESAATRCGEHVDNDDAAVATR